MVYRLVENDEEPAELLESYRRRFVAFGQLIRAALVQADAPVEVADTMERFFTQIALLLKYVIEAHSLQSKKSIETLEFSIEVINGTYWLSEVAITLYKANRGYKLTNAIYKIQTDGLQDLINRLREGESNDV